MGSHLNLAPSQGGMISARDTLITGGTFQQTVTITHNSNQYESLGLFLLSQSVAAGAIHDSAERYPAARCGEGDHPAIIEKILTWSEDPLSSRNTLWISGSPSSGPSRSALAQTVAEKLADNHQLAGSFFFKRDDTERGDCRYLFLTLAYQIAINVPGMREHINSVIYNDPTILTKAAGVHLRSLIIKPFNDLTKTRTPSTSPSYIILIDSFDECEAEFSQRDVLRFILAEASASVHIPLRFVIFSEREAGIQHLFQDSNMYHSVRCLALDQGKNAEITLFRVPSLPLNVRPIPHGQAPTENAVMFRSKGEIENEIALGRRQSSTAPGYTLANRRDDAQQPARALATGHLEAGLQPAGVVVTQPSHHARSASITTEGTGSVSSSSVARFHRPIAVGGEANRHSHNAARGQPHPYSQLRIHHYAVKSATVTTTPPPQVIAHVKQVLEGMGIDFYVESRYMYRCTRPKKKGATTGLAAVTVVGSAASNGVDKRGLPLPSPSAFGGGGTPLGLFMRRQSSQVSDNGPPFAQPSLAFDDETSVVVDEPLSVETIYGEPNRDASDEVRFYVELTRLDGSNDTYSLDITRLKGYSRSYDFIYDTLRERAGARLGFSLAAQA